jgi:hypothetical protein
VVIHHLPGYAEAIPASLDNDPTDLLGTKAAVVAQGGRCTTYASADMINV